MHWIQKEILKRLSHGEKRNYAKLKPKNVESNHFSYHLKKVMESRLISKDDNQYALSSAGKDFVQKLSFSNFDIRIQPSIVTLIICQNREGKFLLYQRSKQPLLNEWGFPSGKLHQNETLGSSAKREFFEKTGLIAKKIQHIGLIYLNLYEDNELFLSLMSHIFFVNDFSGDEKGGRGVKKLTWYGDSEINKMDNKMPGLLEIMKEFKKWNKDKRLFYKEIFKHN